MTATSPLDLPLISLVHALSTGATSARTLLVEILERFDHIEPTLRSFARIDRRAAFEHADEGDRRLRNGQARGVLEGIPVGIKDIFDTAGMVTEYGTPAFTGHVPNLSAEAVLSLQHAGGYVLGKTVTAELAYFHPGPTVNPWDTHRTPGGSSMGSAAAVACGLVPGAIGTQTNGSVIRPAAFCGVVGFKPSWGRLSMVGALPFSPTNDQGGVFARDVAGAAVLASIWANEPLDVWLRFPDLDLDWKPRIGIARTSDWDSVDLSTQELFQSVGTMLEKAGAEVREIDVPTEVDGLAPTHRTIMSREGAYALAQIRANHDPVLSSTLKAFLDEGSATDDATYEAAHRTRLAAIASFATWVRPFDAIIAPAALGEAPARETTGDPRCATRWQSVGAPALALPAALGRGGLPVAIQFVGAHGADARLIRAARWVEGRIEGPGRPNLAVLGQRGDRRGEA